jgi:transcriptional regulator with XRE-family HTH domain
MAQLIVRQLAEKQGLNRNQLQIKSGVTLPLLYRYWSNDTVSVRLDALEKIANALGVKPQELIVSDAEAKEMGVAVAENAAEDDRLGRGLPGSLVA